jgi:LTXXQ motif family protein
MKLRTAIFRTIPIVGMLAGAAIGFPAIPAAQGQAAPATPKAPTMMDHPVQPAGPDPYVEGQIAFWKAALAITPAQAARWQKVASVIRENNRETQQRYDWLESEPAQPQTAVQRVEAQLESAELSAKETKRFLDAFRPFYASLSPDQKATADELVGQSPEYAAPPPPNEPPPAAPTSR